VYYKNLWISSYRDRIILIRFSKVFKWNEKKILDFKCFTNRRYIFAFLCR